MEDVEYALTLVLAAEAFAKAAFFVLEEDFPRFSD